MQPHAGVAHYDLAAFGNNILDPNLQRLFLKTGLTSDMDAARNASVAFRKRVMIFSIEIAGLN